MNRDRQLESAGLHARFVTACLEVASTFLTIAATAYSSGEKSRGNRAIAKASRSLHHAARFIGDLSAGSPVAATVLQDRLTLLRRERDRLSRGDSAKVIEFPAA